MSQELFAKVDRYIETLYGEPDAALAGVEQSLIDADMPLISVSPAQGRYLHMLCRLVGAKRVLEVGTLAGYSTIWLARALPADGRLITIESDPDHARVARKNFDAAGVADRIELRVGRGLDVMPALREDGAGPFDVVFIDADKAPLAEYFELALELSRPGTLIIADNVIREGKVLEEISDDEMVRGVQRFNRVLAASDAVDSSIMQTVGAKEHDGIALAVVR